MDRPAAQDAAALVAGIEHSLRNEGRFRSNFATTNPSAVALLASQGAERVAAALAMFDRVARLAVELDQRSHDEPWPGARWTNLHSEIGNWYTFCEVLSTLIGKGCKFSPADWEHVWACVAKFGAIDVFSHRYLPRLLTNYEKTVTPPVTGPVADSLAKVAAALGLCGNAAEQRLSRRVHSLLGQAATIPIEPKEVWADAAIAATTASTRAQAWAALLTACADTKGSASSAPWKKSARALVKAVTARELHQRLLEWFPLVDKPQPDAVPADWRWNHHAGHRISERNQDILKGLCWCAALSPDADRARALARLALSAYRKVPGIGPRAVKVGNAAVIALGNMGGLDALGQLAFLRVKVKFGTAQKVIEKALGLAAAAANLPREEIEELGVPAYGMEQVGLRQETLGDFKVEMAAQGATGIELRWFSDKGKPTANPPAALKRDHADDLKELRAAAKDAAAMLSAQRDRLDAMFCDARQWPLATWRERYLDHPLVGVVARRLIWRIGDGDRWESVAWLDDRPGGPGLARVDGQAWHGSDSLRVRMWHPVEVPVQEVLAWREFFEKRTLVQPFKQAHREVYLLTDAERRTGTYSNRFAAHILRQHQFNALCALRNWRNRLRLCVDGDFPPASRPLAPAGLRAEFWVEGLGDHTNETGVYTYLTTDQVRFYRLAAPGNVAHAGGGQYGNAAGEPEDPVPLEQVPPLVFSEVMRDVDLFVGVASVGNNPEWSDGGPEGEFREYWWNFGFSPLSETGLQRRQTLERLLPRLAIAPACSLSGNFLHVRGSLRSYKIHLGSGNILMSPNDEYLCIVPAQSTARHDKVYLPFEGDRTLGIILSKAIMLAADADITDPSITRQIRKA